MNSDQTSLEERVEIRKESPARDTLERYLAKLCNHPILDDSEVVGLVLQAQKGDARARDRVLSHNQRLIISLAKPYFRQGKEMDLVQEGNIALLHAIRKFLPNQGASFAWYARIWILGFVRRAYQNDMRPFRVPAYMIQDMHTLRAIHKRLSLELKREPNKDELMKKARESGIETPEATLQTQQTSTVSFDAPLDKDSLGGDTFGSLFPDTERLTTIGQIEAKETLVAMKENLQKFIASVEGMRRSTRSKAIFLRYYELDGKGKRETMRAVGQSYGITRQGVNQIIVGIWKTLARHGINFNEEKLARLIDNIDQLETMTYSSSC